MPNVPNMSEIWKLAQSPAGQQLLAMLQNTDQSALDNAAKQASTGNMEAAKNSLSALLSSPEVQALLKQMEGSL